MVIFEEGLPVKEVAYWAAISVSLLVCRVPKPWLADGSEEGRVGSEGSCS